MRMLCLKRSILSFFCLGIPPAGGIPCFGFYLNLKPFARTFVKSEPALRASVLKPVYKTLCKSSRCQRQRRNFC